MAHLQHVVVAILMVLDVKLVDGDGDAAASGGGNIPDALSVFWVSVGVVRAVEGATRSGELPSTACTGTNNPRLRHKREKHTINPNTDVVLLLLVLLFGSGSILLPILTYYLSLCYYIDCL